MAQKPEPEDLTFLKCDLVKIIILDTDPKNFVTPEENAIAAPKFKGDPKDTWLLKSVPFFEYLYMMETDDVRQLLAKFGNYDTMENYEKWEKQIVETLKEDWEKKQHQNEKQGNSVWSYLGSAFGMHVETQKEPPVPQFIQMRNNMRKSFEINHAKMMESVLEEQKRANESNQKLMSESTIWDMAQQLSKFLKSIISRMSDEPYTQSFVPHKWNIRVLKKLKIEIIDTDFHGMFGMEEFNVNIDDIVLFDQTHNALGIQFNNNENGMNSFHNNINFFINELSTETIDYKTLSTNSVNEISTVIYKSLNEIVQDDYVNEETVRKVSEGFLTKYCINRFEGYSIRQKPKISFFTGQGSFCIPDLVIRDHRNKIRYILIQDDKQAENVGDCQLIAYMLNAVFTNSSDGYHNPIIGILYSLTKPKFFKIEIPQQNISTFKDDILSRCFNVPGADRGAKYTVLKYIIPGRITENNTIMSILRCYEAIRRTMIITNQ
ncbi:hypothetical protein BB560_002234 [Smittium megazygosporum]|uniref:FCP1 homology domain-containing protein n=1 Tax=Smittium megazygosporum TaxID=133381 RepID=A0A2T9ZFD6_9FUNG|nr:hypothetical protein BB560_002234 [Smittium megazygosporum]